MDDTAKYLIHARIAAEGVVERSDVVGAVFGQTEGLLGDELDLRDLQQSSKVGRIDVEISSENGQSFGELTIATSLDKAETAVLGASLETIERVGPCRASIEVTSIEDVRAAKRRAVVDRAKELLATAFDETAISSEELLSDVRESAQVEEITEYAGLPAGPSVASSDAIIVVEGRADVLQLLKHGIKNAIGVEGTNIPEAVASLTAEKTVTVFVDGDRGGELILRELLQVGDVDYVVFAPADQSVEDLSRKEIHGLLREKIAADRIGDAQNIRETIAGLIETSDLDFAVSDADEGSAADPTDTAETNDAEVTDSPTEVEVIPTSSDDLSGDDAEMSTTEPEPPSTADPEPTPTADETVDIEPTNGADSPETADSEATDDTTAATESDTPATLRSHVRAVIGEGTGTARLLSESFELLAEVDPEELVATLETADEAFALVFDGELTQRMLDVAAQRGLDHVVVRSTGEFVKQPVGTRVLTAEQLRAAELDVEA
ncbi:DNA primase DnaG [Halohasta litorea]|uniref:DNA primase DnaG n=1 Tax=Halohasta litorea TaxID=869891 RepID=A0ABD6D9B5_9EURY|nr:DNA primase DnaG [Halohasta litorea]